MIGLTNTLTELVGSIIDRKMNDDSDSSVERGLMFLAELEDEAQSLPEISFKKKNLKKVDGTNAGKLLKLLS